LDYLQQALKLHSEGQFAAAEPLYQAALKIDPNLSMPSICSASCAFAKGGMPTPSN